DLGADPPKVVRRGRERQGDLSAGIAAVSPSAENLFIICQAPPPAGGRHEPSRRAKVFRTNELAFHREVDLSITACRGLVASLDGKYIYALDSDHAKLAVIDVATAKEVKVIENVGKYPRFLFAIQEPSI